ncbi:MaoC family dehydratase [Xylophilus sp. Leaf220]|uniref:MaoC family dehydratase n=1 Tax=Xylophilus sp. Leaf220 TaxID=1735686 RepID=UPI0006F66312|nr:MaoC family dehydratase [Xylophilus sp. Leaf220]KQM80316.1 dehydratase [Xylophilus sp. Leaf220]
MKTFKTLADVAALVGQEVASSDWTTVTQEQVQRFADATHDHQWIHLDAERASKGPFGAPIAHGFLTLSLLPALMQSTLSIEEARMGVNYGLNKVRFPSPVPVGSRLRARFALQAAEQVDNRGWQFTWQATIEREGGTKPVCVAETLSRLYP